MSKLYQLSLHVEKKSLHERQDSTGNKVCVLVNNSASSKGSSVPTLFFSRKIDLHADSVFSRHMNTVITATAD